MHSSITPTLYPGGALPTGALKIACVLITHLRAKVEMRRHPHLKDNPAVIVDRSGPKPVVVDHLPACRGIAVGMTLDQALSRQTDAVVLEADEQSYRRVFGQALASLQGISDRVERSDLGVAYVGLDGLEDMYGGEARLVNALLNAAPQDLAPRVGVARAKFPALVAALSSAPLGAERAPEDAASFLAPHSIDLLPVDPSVKAAMHRFGLHVMGDVASMASDTLADQFGLPGKTAWRLCRGVDDSPLVPMKEEEYVEERISMPFASNSLEFLQAAVDALLKRAYARPEMRGRYAGRADLRCALNGAPAWERSVHFKQSAGSPQRASFIIRSRLEADRPQAPVEDVALALAGLTGESGVQMGLLPDVREGRERRLVEVERELQSRAGGVSVLHRVTEVAPGHPAPEMRSVQVPVDARGREGLRPVSTPTENEVRAGPDGGPAEVRTGNNWHRVARVEDTWSFDLWWMPRPLTRTYYRVGIDDGRHLTIFLDHRDGCWYRQPA